MQEDKIILKAFLAEQFQAHGLEINDAILKAITSTVQIEEGEPDESQETRSVKITEDTDGKLAAQSFKFYNIIKMSYHDLVGFLLKESGIYFMEDDKVKIFFSILFLLHDFSPKLTYKFNETDAKILLAIYENDRKEFSVADVQAAYQQHFAQALSEEQASRSLNHFKDLKVVEYLGAGKYLPREKMTYERN
jgi:hypothetical protein